MVVFLINVIFGLKVFFVVFNFCVDNVCLLDVVEDCLFVEEVEEIILYDFVEFLEFLE